MVAEGRRVLGNIERTSSLYLTKTFYALVLTLSTGVASVVFPFLPRHLTLITSLTIGIPSFFLALAPSAERACSCPASNRWAFEGKWSTHSVVRTCGRTIRVDAATKVMRCSWSLGQSSSS